MTLVVLPGVFAPISDTRLLADSLRSQISPGASTVLDLCTGSGALAIAAARARAKAVSAVDISWLAVWNARLNARLNGTRIEIRRGDLLAPFAGRRFDLIVSNPPYVPAQSSRLPSRGRARAWDAGPDGRAVLDRICAEAPAQLKPGGALLVIHSSWCDEQVTLERMRAAGLRAETVARERGALGPLLSARAAEIQARGLVAPGTSDEELLVVRGSAQPDRSASRHDVNQLVRQPIVPA
jgi:release factor glutamine methyltransferase